MENRWPLLFLFLAAIDFNKADAALLAIFILGDSAADIGTNNFLPGSKARANFPYISTDLPYSRPTGRFSNGFNSADFFG